MFQRRSTWFGKFACSLRGVQRGIAGQSSFVVHIPAALLVLLLGFYRGVDLVGWVLLTLCIGIVIAGELFNSALESMAKAVTVEENAHIRDALDVASGAVLVLSVAAAVGGILVLFVRVST